MRKVRNFLFSQESGEFFLFMLFFFVAAGFWLIQTLDNEYETDITIPVRLKDVPDNVLLTSDVPPSVKVHVKDKGTMLFNYLMGKVFIPVNIDFVTGEGNHVQIPSSAFSRTIANQFNSSTQVISIVPDTLEYYYSTGRSKKVPVRFRGTAAAGPRHYLADTLFTPDSVRVYAPLSLLDTIKAAYTEPLELKGIDDTLKQEVRLMAERGVKFVPETTTLTLSVDMYTEKTVEVELHGINFPPNKQLRAFPSRVSVTFQCGLKQFNQFTADDFHIFVSYEDLLKLGNQKYTVRLRNTPKGISNVRFNPSQVDFLIEQIDSADSND